MILSHNPVSLYLRKTSINQETVQITVYELKEQIPRLEYLLHSDRKREIILVTIDTLFLVSHRQHV